MDYRSAGLIMLGALIMSAQHRHDVLPPAQRASEAVELQYQACIATEHPILDRTRNSRALEDSDGHSVWPLPAPVYALGAFRQNLSALRRTFDEVKDAALLLGWQLLGDERTLRALLRVRRLQPGVRCERVRVVAVEPARARTRAGFALHSALTPVV